MQHIAGRLLKITAVGHAIVGLILFRVPLAGIVGDGMLNVVAGRFDREAAFWFLLFSPVCFALGQLVEHASERGDSRTLGIIGWNLLGIGLVGAAAMPVSGFWLLIGIAPLVLQAARGGAVTTAA